MPHDKDVLLIPANYLFSKDSAKFEVNFTNKNLEAIAVDSETSASIAAKKDQLIKCRIRSIMGDNLAAVKIEIEPGKFLYADLKFIAKDPVNGISIFRYASPKDMNSVSGRAGDSSPSISPILTPSSPSGSRPRSGLLLLFSKGSSGSGSKLVLKKWYSWDLSATSQDVMQILQANETFSTFNLTHDAGELDAKRRLVLARRKLLNLNFERFSSKETQQWTDSKIIKETIARKLKSELESMDVIPNLFESQFTPNITELLNIYKTIGSASEIESDIANIYEAILQSLFKQNEQAIVLGNIIAAWSHDRDIIKDHVPKTVLMDLLSVLNMVCVDKNIIEAAYRRQYPKMIMVAEDVVRKYASMYPENQDGIGSPPHVRGKSVIAKDMSDFDRRFEKLRVKAPQVNKAQLYI